MKGTRRGVETILGMFGYSPDENLSKEGTFKIDEHVFVVLSGLSYTDASYFRNMAENVTESNFEHLMEGFPVALVSSVDGSGNTLEYLIPWYNKHESYLYPFYFQSSGGWGKRSSKKINLSITTAQTLTSNGSVAIYGETQPYLKFASNIDEMLSFNHVDLMDDMICYVTDISNIDDVYTKYGEEGSNYSHYFSLKNVSLSTRCGFLQNEIYNCYGWKNIQLDEITNCSTDDARRVIYLESLNATFAGNNPHVGNGKYDDGESYIENFTNIFKGLYNDGFFDHIEVDDDILDENDKKTFDEIRNGQYGFKYFTDDKVGGEIIDNKKCAYFHDYSYNGDLWEPEEENNEQTNTKTDKTKTTEKEATDGGESTDTETEKESTESGESTDTETVKDIWNSELYASLIEFPDTPINSISDVADESQANGIINIKKLVITFGTNNNEHLRNYIQDVVMKYLEEMIPSTSILEYRFDNEEPMGDIGSSIGGHGTFSFIRTAHVAVEKDNDNVTVWREYPEE
jgi:hypothetical protein